MIDVPLSTAARIISPRVTALINTLDENGIVNSAPYSFVHPLSTKHRLIGIVIGGKHKHTYVNSKRVGEFVVSLVSEDFAEQAIRCQEPHALGENVLEKHGLHTQASKKVKVPRVREARAILECKLKRFVELGDDQLLMVGEVVHAEADGENGEFDLDKIRPLLHETADRYRGIGRAIIIRSG